VSVPRLGTDAVSRTSTHTGPGARVGAPVSSPAVRNPQRQPPPVHATCTSSAGRGEGRVLPRGVPGGAPPPSAPPRPVHVLLVDDHVLLREGLHALLRGVPQVRVVGEVGSAEDVVAVAVRHRPDVVVVDIRLGTRGDDGLELCRMLTATVPTARILVLTAEVSESLTLAALRAGVRGVLLTSSDFDALTRAIADVAAGRNAFDHRVAGIVAGLLRSADRGVRITAREHDVLALVARGLSNRAIGTKLAISETTVKFHLSNLMRKTGTSTRAETVFTAGRLGLV